MALNGLLPWMGGSSAPWLWWASGTAGASLLAGVGAYLLGLHWLRPLVAAPTYRRQVTSAPPGERASTPEEAFGELAPFVRDFHPQAWSELDEQRTTRERSARDDGSLVRAGMIDAAARRLLGGRGRRFRGEEQPPIVPPPPSGQPGARADQLEQRVTELSLLFDLLRVANQRVGDVATDAETGEWDPNRRDTLSDVLAYESGAKKLASAPRPGVPAIDAAGSPPPTAPLEDSGPVPVPSTTERLPADPDPSLIPRRSRPQEDPTGESSFEQRTTGVVSREASGQSETDALVWGLSEVEQAASHSGQGEPLELETLLGDLVALVGERLRLREAAILIKNTKGELEVTACYGVNDPDTILGRVIGLGEGIAGAAAEADSDVFIDDVKEAQQYLSFWGNVQREGSYAALPIRDNNGLQAMLSVTRAPSDPLGQRERRLLRAAADTIALAIRHARLVEELRRTSTHDELTGLPNRRLLQERMALEVERATRFNHPLSLLAIDIDHFKRINDRLGHPVGDQALVGVANTLRDRLRRIDTIARVGGEEFVVLLPRTSLEKAEFVAEDLRAHVETASIAGAEAQPGGRVTISIGVAAFAVNDEASDLWHRSDQALYRAKKLGRNRVVVTERNEDDESQPRPKDGHKRRQRSDIRSVLRKTTRRSDEDSQSSGATKG